MIESGRECVEQQAASLVGVCIASVLLSGSKFRPVIYWHIFMAHTATCDIHLLFVFSN